MLEPAAATFVRDGP